MTGASPAIFTRLQQQRSSVVQGFLWILLVFVVLVFIISATLVGPLNVTLGMLVPHLVNVSLITGAMWLNHRQHTRLAVGLIVGVSLALASLRLVAGGISGNEISLLLFFLPVVLAGLLLDRWSLYITAGVTLLTAVLTPVLHGAELPLGEPVTRDDAWVMAIQFGVIVAAVTFFLDRFGLMFQAALRNAVEHEVAVKQEATERLKTSEALLEEKRFNDVIIENLPGVFYVLDESGSYFKWNRNFTDVFGYDDEDMKHLNLLDLFEGEERDLIARSITETFTNGSGNAEATVIAKDGKRIPYVLNGARVTLGGTTYLAGIGIDRSEIDAAQARIRALNEELAERLERITALHEIDKAITGSLDLDLTLKVVLEQVTQRLHIDAATILLFRSASQSLRYGASLGFNGAALRRTDLRLGQGLAGRAGLNRERVVVNDSEAFATAFADASSLEDEDFHSYVAVPLVAKGQLQGVLELFHRSPLEPSDDWYAFLTTLATQAAIALDSTRMFHDLERSNQELRLAYDTTIEGWARALDLKDEETEGHSRRVTDLTVRLAEQADMDDEDLVHVRRGALLHDIGKMGIPDSVLLKPGKLDADEWALMKQHTVFAYDLLAPIAFLRPALDIPYYHHEKWDGSGYPRGLKGDQIPLAARLFAVVDVYDALTSDRPYRAAWSEERALQHIREGSGSHFDPTTVDAFLALMGKAT